MPLQLRTCAAGAAGGKPIGAAEYRLQRLAASSPPSRVASGSSSSVAPGHVAVSGFVTDADDFVFALSRRRVDDDDVAFVLADQRTRDG